jgi:beta-galactosidase
MPHHLTIDLGRAVTLRGITYLPRQDGANGRIAECEIYCSTEPNSWAAPTAKVKWPNTDQLQTVNFKLPVKARYLKVVARSEVNHNPYASIAELDVLTDEK